MLNEADLINGQNPLFRALSYVLLTSLITPHIMVNSIIPLTAQKYRAEIHLEAASFKTIKQIRFE